MNRKEICAFLIKCEPNEFMAYADQAERGCVVIAPDGRKYRFENDQLEQAELEAKAKARRSKPKRKPAKKPAAKPSTKKDPKLL